MSNTFELKIVSPDKVLYDGQIQSLIAPAALGYLGVLAGHAPLIANLKPGNVFIKDTSGKQTTTRIDTNGFLQVLKNRATILLD